MEGVMQGGMVVILKTPKGKYKGYVWGSPNYHMMDWRGCNYHIRSIEGQPHLGFLTVEECEEFIRAKFPTEEDMWNWSARSDGTFMTDEVFKRRVKDINLPRKPKPAPLAGSTEGFET